MLHTLKMKTTLLTLSLLVLLVGELAKGATIPSSTNADITVDTTPQAAEIKTIIYTSGTETTTKSRRQRKQNRQKAPSKYQISPNELDDIIFNRIQEVEKAKKICTDGEYYNYAVKACGSCKDCTSHVDLDLCGIECDGYFKNEDLKQELHWSRVISYILGGFVAILAIACIVLVFFCNKTRNGNDLLQDRVEKIEDRNRGAPDGDQGPADSQQPLI